MHFPATESLVSKGMEQTAKALSRIFPLHPDISVFYFARPRLPLRKEAPRSPNFCAQLCTVIDEPL